MAGIYIHIPFCKQACYYCDFHFSTSLKKKPQLVKALNRELILRKEEPKEPIETIYFGGGTPSLLSAEELKSIFDTVFQNYRVLEGAEITLEANPDDLTAKKLKELSASKVNRLSIGVQSFYEEDLVWMNRSHNAEQALQALKGAKRYFDNISMDLIYGVPGMSNEKWKHNLEQFMELDLPHVSCYALTVEPRTALAKMIQLKKKQPVEDELAKAHYEILIDTLPKAGYINYEFSNFGKPDYFSKNNTAYWTGKQYVGIGPSAHGYDGTHRYWNARNNTLYIGEIEKGHLPQRRETLSAANRYNEYIMTHLRTIWGISTAFIAETFGKTFSIYFEKESRPLFDRGLLEKREGAIHITAKGKFLGDGISSDLFYVEEKTC